MNLNPFSIIFLDFLYPPYEECEDSLNISDDDIPDEKDGKMMQNKTSFNNTHTIKNIPMKSFIELTCNFSTIVLLLNYFTPQIAFYG